MVSPATQVRVVLGPGQKALEGANRGAGGTVRLELSLLLCAVTLPYGADGVRDVCGMCAQSDWCETRALKVGTLPLTTGIELLNKA